MLEVTILSGVFLILIARKRNDGSTGIYSIISNIEYDYKRENIIIGNVAVKEDYEYEEVEYIEDKGRINNILKRCFDIVISFLALILICSWLFPIIALLIKLTSKGPVFYRQKRCGKRGKEFEILKFRTMRTDAESIDEYGNFIQAQRFDNRVTKFGRFLRKSSLDEFPQFINVLKGEMSLIGPRPHPIELDNIYKYKLKNYLKRYSVKPGISGLSQITGLRGETPEVETMAKRVKTDLYYIENWSFFLDLRITIRTFITLLKGDIQAY